MKEKYIESDKNVWNAQDVGTYIFYCCIKSYLYEIIKYMVTSSEHENVRTSFLNK